MVIDRLRLGAKLLVEAASALSGGAPGGLASEALTDVMRLTSVDAMKHGSDAVRSMGGPFFSRIADDLLTQAALVQGGGPTGPAINAAMDGATWLLKRASTMP